MKTYFVTGGAGFIGSAFIRLVLAETPDIRIVTYDLLTYAGSQHNLADLDPERHTFVRGDICDRSAVLKGLPDGADAVINFAAESHVDRSIASASEFVRTNVLGTQVLLDAVRTRGVGRFCQISTDEVMGSLPDTPDTFFTEDCPLRPNSPYAASKAAAEHLVRAARHSFGMETVITRSGNNYGPRQFPEKLVPLVITNALANCPIPVYGDGRNVRDWIYVEDHCRALLPIIENGDPGETYNIGARNELQNINVVRSILDALGKPHSLIEYVVDRPAHDRRYAIDPTKIETDFAWRPMENWGSGLEKTIRWYVDNGDWTGRVRNSEYHDYYMRQYGREVGA